MGLPQTDKEVITELQAGAALLKRERYRLLDKVKQQQDCIREIEAVSCGEEQVAEDDSEGTGWIYKRIQTLKKDLLKS